MYNEILLRKGNPAGSSRWQMEEKEENEEKRATMCYCCPFDGVIFGVLFFDSATQFQVSYIFTGKCL